ncbi:adenylate/guanylate cyclase domain-containing protein [Polynucleobacter sp. IMCC30063]|uniref:adenylate/guanylate cyclase domain-containing protein n=2 Tax=unclassified Polynucleobacter TaxID=2640945 RepID=UPI001F22683D|nr:adenylate/guanylate cyclase domain-containing protein [Polynucleobacter sp. IMCC30063]MCE7505501.1 adenylate/guanylate cyclase domain-containing protein [Polynucleobacter sp. IMCC30063]
MSKDKKFLPNFIKQNINLRISISVIFLMLIIPAFITFIFYSYRTNYLIYKQNAINLVVRANEESIHSLIEFLDPIVDAVRVTSKMVASNPELINQEKITEHSIVNLENNLNVVSYFLSSKDGSFRQVQRTNQAIPIAGRVPPEGSQYVSWVIDRSKNQNGESTYTFFKSWGDVIAKFTSPNKYDPRERPFYKGITKNFSEGKFDIPLIEDPYFTNSTKQAVISISHPITVSNQLLGSVTAQVKVASFADFLLKNKISKNSQTIIFNEQGDVIVHPEVNLGFIKEKDTLVPRKIVDLDSSPASVAKKIYDQIGSKQIEFTFGENKVPYLANFNSFPANYIKPWIVMTVVPLDDFMAELNIINQRLIIFGIFAFILIAFLTFYFSKLISKPLESLTTEIQNIFTFKSDDYPQVTSSIYEISTLSNAIKRLKSTIAAFTSYVPKDLVNDLLSSGKAIELGGESRYLTVLFSDLKDFSTLSEITPSRELLLRVSSYLELMTYAIKEEGGTIDKFIGDSVMAFWGAPLLDQNHAYHACVAAFKTKRRMVFLNEKLVAEEKPPLVVRIGIHSDAVLVGNIGSAERLSYTVMGDGVNIAARLEGINKEFNTDICISHSLFKEAGERLWVRPIDQITVKGRKGELIIYELMGIQDGDAETAPTEIEKELCIFTKKAFDLYMNGSYVEALVIYEDLVLRFDDGLAAVMVAKCRNKIN